MIHKGTITLKTERLTLRSFAASDAEQMFNNWASDDEVTRYMRWETHKAVEDSSFVLDIWLKEYESGEYYNWAMSLENGELIGSIGFVEINKTDSRAEIGYCIGRKYWGNGYATEAAKAVIKFMFEEVGLNRIEAFHSISNPASGKVLNKAGMALEGTAKQKCYSREGFQDCDMYGITHEEWEVAKEIEHYNSLPVIFRGFVDTSGISNGEIELKCLTTHEADPVKKWVPAYSFEICKRGEKVGQISLRLGYTESLYYGGQIGYIIDEAHRGNGYAAEACKLLIPIMKAHGMEKVLITTDPNNAASKRVCEKLGARFIRTARLPKWHDLYIHGGMIDKIPRKYSDVYEWMF